MLIFICLFYLFLNINLFAWLFVLRRVDKRGNVFFVENLQDFAGFYLTSPTIAFLLACVFFSYAGIPPFLGFFSKFFVLLLLAISGVFFYSSFNGVVKRYSFNLLFVYNKAMFLCAKAF
jgi:NADH-quinone oxidoreductase subunit N